MDVTTNAVVHRYMERGAGGFANITLPSGERIFVSLAINGLRVHRLILWGRIPGKTLHVADARAVHQAVRVIARDIDRLPKLPNNAAMDAFITMATAAIKDPSAYRQPQDEDDFPMSNLTVLTRAALAEPDAASYVRRLERAAATP